MEIIGTFGPHIYETVHRRHENVIIYCCNENFSLFKKGRVFSLAFSDNPWEIT